MEPAAVTKAASLRRHVDHLGVPADGFLLALTTGEAYELLDYLASGALGRARNHAALEADIAAAKLDGNPWAVLSEWRLHGFELVPVTILN